MLGEVELLELQDEARVLAPDRGHESLPCLVGVLVGEEADPDRAGDPASADLGHPPEVRGVVEELLRERQELRPGPGQRDGLARPLEEVDAELRLERLDLLADGRLGDVDLLRGTAEMELAGDGHEVLELAEFHDRPCDRQRQ